MSGATAPAYLEGIQSVCIEMCSLSRSEHTSARDGADLRSSIRLLDSIGKPGPVNNGPLVLRLTLLLHELLQDSKQGTTVYLTDQIYVGWFQWGDCTDIWMSDKESRPPTASEIKAICQEIYDFSVDGTFAY
jgi:hypothetical protein